MVPDRSQDPELSKHFRRFDVVKLDHDAAATQVKNRGRMILETSHGNFDLEFAPDATVFGGALGKGSDDAQSPNLFSAMQQQLGLRLEKTKGLVSALVIDHVERPSEN